VKKPRAVNKAPDSYFRNLGWQSISRDADGHAASAIGPGFPEEYDEWVDEQFELGRTVVELQS
jgi:hypothetical protein